MYVCHCRAVTDRSIAEAIEAGACDPESVTRRCGAGAACGGCMPTVRALLAHYGLAEAPDPATTVTAA